MIERNTRAPKMLPNWELAMSEYHEAILGEIVTLSEACLIWGKSRNALKNAVLTHKIAGRRAFTGGDWLVSVASLITVYGKPSEEKDVLSWLKSK